MGIEVGKIPFLDGVTIYALIYFGLVDTAPHAWTWMTIFAFPLKMFATDFVNDIFYYSMHRYWHTPEAYNTHKLHHLVKYPVSFIAGIMSTEEMLLTFIATRIVVPVIFVGLLGPWNITEFLAYNCYLGFLEILGLSGQVLDEINNTSRFGQAFIVTTLGINLEVGAHDLHHEFWNCNFGKRMCFMD